jgi:hypothetical protein
MFSRRSIESLTKRKHASGLLTKLPDSECLALLDPRALGLYSGFNAVGQLLLAPYYGCVNPGAMVVESVANLYLAPGGRTAEGH